MFTGVCLCRISQTQTERGGYSQRWSGTTTSCAASWTLSWSSSGRLHSVKPWSWSPPSPSPLYSAHKRTHVTYQPGECVILCSQIKMYLHGFTESVGEVQLLVFQALDCEETTQTHLVHLWFPETEEFSERTQSEEGLLQVSLHLLPDALLHVVGTVALIPLKHCHIQNTTFIQRSCWFFSTVSFFLKGAS